MHRVTGKKEILHRIRHEINRKKSISERDKTVTSRTSNRKSKAGY
jgi:hypothetical protein